MPKIATRKMYEKIVTCLNKSELTLILTESKLKSNDEVLLMSEKHMKRLVMESEHELKVYLLNVIEKGLNSGV